MWWTTLNSFKRLSFLLLLGGVVHSQAVTAEVIEVFEVQKELALSNDQKVFKDYYLTGGAENGLKPGMVVGVVREQTLHDNIKNQARGQLVFRVAQLIIIHVQKDIAVARFYKGSDARHRPVTPFNAVMIGDKIDLSSAFIPEGKNSQKNEEPASPAGGVMPAMQITRYDFMAKP